MKATCLFLGNMAILLGFISFVYVAVEVLGVVLR